MCVTFLRGSCGWLRHKRVLNLRTRETWSAKKVTATIRFILEWCHRKVCEIWHDLHLHRKTFHEWWKLQSQIVNDVNPENERCWWKYAKCGVSIAFAIPRFNWVLSDELFERSKEKKSLCLQRTLSRFDCSSAVLRSNETHIGTRWWFAFCCTNLWIVTQFGRQEWNKSG